MRSHLFLAGLVLLAFAGAGRAIDEKECVEKGFQPDTLLCTSCKKLQEHVKSEEVYDECMQCCTEVQEEEKVEKFASASIEVCS
mmetsp:Transcript_20021/g.51093  ORF Transcript_20021/g.51093 Transcript_20021/m.51093 type:complete len:84 (+) Transcript_20021:310-561(+)